MKKALKNMVVGSTILLSSFTDDVNAQSRPDGSSSLNSKQQSIVTISAFTANGNQEQLNHSLNGGLDAGLSINEIKEILVHLYAYTGFPRSLNAISTFEAVVNERKKKGVKDEAGKEPGKQSFKNGKFEFGKDVQTKLTGTTAIGAAQKFVPIIDTFLKEHLFADIFSRNTLDYQSREVATISALASLTGTEAQLKSHLNVGKNTGLTEQQLRSIAFILLTKVGWREGNTATKTIDNIFSSTDKTVTDKNPLSNNQVSEIIFPKGTRIANNNFTGTAWLQMLVNNDTSFNTSIGNVTFEPGARTRWHYHPGGQILLITNGKGLYQEKGKLIRELQKGDIIKCEPDITHWHGATPDSELSHLAIGTNPDKASVIWLQPVSDEEYNNVQR